MFELYTGIRVCELYVFLSVQLYVFKCTIVQTSSCSSSIDIRINLLLAVY